MRPVAITLALPILALVLAPPAVGAVPTSHLAWDACGGPLVRVLAPGQSAVTLYAWITGLDFAHQGFAASFAFAGDDPHACRSAADGRLEPADAWRFDVVGCQGPERASFDFAPAASLGCRWIGGAPNASTARHVDPAPSYMPPEWIRFLGVASYPTLPAPPASQALLLFAVRLDLSDARTGAAPPGSCGGLEAPLYVVDRWTELVEGVGCVERTLQATITDADGIAHPIAPGGARLTVDATPRPARSASWGRIKAQYR
jgi:hypothetical protein